MSTPEILDALRENDREAFLYHVGQLGTAQLEQANTTRYSNWFPGVGATLLQITSFVRPEFAPVLIERGVKIDFHSACGIGNLKVMRETVEGNPRALDRSVAEFYPIQFALRSADAVRVLLANGEDPNRRLGRVGWFEWEDAASEHGLSSWTPLHMLALGRGAGPFEETAEALRDCGAIVDASSTPFGEAPIHLSAIYDRASLLRWFVGNGCDVDQPTLACSGGVEEAELFDLRPYMPFHLAAAKTPLMLAVGEGQDSAARTLLALGARVDARDSRGYTPLHYAAGAFWGENVELAELLLHGGGRRAEEADNGERPVDLAERKGYHQIVRLLSQ